MKKKLVFLILLLVFMVVPVDAANYEMKELIPEGITTTIRGDYFLYKDIAYKEGVISFTHIKNLSSESRKLSISIGLFGEDKKNIGTINYCEGDLKSQEKKDKFVIDVKKSYMSRDKSFKDIKYISVLNENPNCRTEGALDFEGQTVEQIGLPKNTSLDKHVKDLILIVEIVAAILVVLFVYRFVFTPAYQNMDGTDTRQEYAYINKQLRKEREHELKVNPPKPKEVKKNKTDEQKEQEKIEQEKVKNQDVDLFDMYK